MKTKRTKSRIAADADFHVEGKARASLRFALSISIPLAVVYLLGELLPVIAG